LPTYVGHIKPFSEQIYLEVPLSKFSQRFQSTKAIFKLFTLERAASMLGVAPTTMQQFAFEGRIRPAMIVRAIGKFDDSERCLFRGDDLARLKASLRRDETGK
ncbi:MAG: hypothetical protein WCC76_05105, partial [Candidatus Acidiferrales bacterium]|jgi:hypothetical protein